MSKLTEKQKRFADYYIESGNATDAARKAGYKQPHVQGSQNLEKLSIKAYIDTKLDEMDSKRIASASEVLQFLSSVVRGEIDEEVIVNDLKGYDRIRKELDIKDRIKAAESLLKRYPMNRQEELKNEKLEADTEYIKERTKLLKGAAKDTTLMEALIDAVKGGG